MYWATVDLDDGREGERIIWYQDLSRKGKENVILGSSEVSSDYVLSIRSSASLKTSKPSLYTGKRKAE